MAATAAHPQGFQGFPPNLTRECQMIVPFLQLKIDIQANLITDLSHIDFKSTPFRRFLMQSFWYLL
jgi:hypothetical protein